MNKIKKIFSLLFAMCFIFSIVPFSSFADGHYFCLESGHNHKNEFAYVTNFEKEITVELKNEKDFFTYPRNPNYKYTFIIQSPISTRAICHKCGRGTLGLARVQEQKSKLIRACPVSQWGSDYMDTWANYDVERCTSCGYSVIAYTRADTYTSTCKSSGGNYTVVKGHDMAHGYDIHESYDYWVRGVMS